MYYIVVQKLVKTCARHAYTFCLLYFQVACNCLNSLKQEVKQHSYHNLSIKGEKYQLDLSKLIMLWSDCFLSQSKYFDQLSHRKTKQKQK